MKIDSSLLHVFIICVIQLESKWTQTTEWFKWLECVCVGCSVWRVWSEVPFSISSHQSPVPSSQQVCASDFDLACTNCSIAHLTKSPHMPASYIWISQTLESPKPFYSCECPRQNFTLSIKGLLIDSIPNSPN